MIIDYSYLLIGKELSDIDGCVWVISKNRDIDLGDKPSRFCSTEYTIKCKQCAQQITFQGDALLRNIHTLHVKNKLSISQLFQHSTFAILPCKEYIVNSILE